MSTSKVTPIFSSISKLTLTFIFLNSAKNKSELYVMMFESSKKSK